MTTDHDVSWADVDTCTLPTADRPLRAAEFDELFAASLRSIELVGTTRARLVLQGVDVDRVRRLASAESSCCSFFAFEVSATDDAVLLDIGVPPTRSEVLAGLVDRAESVRRGTA